MRTFRAKRGAQAVVSHCLTTLASATIRQVGGTTVSIFRVENEPQEFVWLGDRGQDRDFDRLAPLSGDIVEWLRYNLAPSATERTLRLVEDYHRRSSMPYQIWSVEVQAPDECGLDPVFDLREARGDARLLAAALYRSVDDPTIVVLILGLTWGMTPTAIGFSAARVGGATISGTLSLVVDLRRLSCEVAPGAARAEPVRLPEWIRNGTARNSAALRVHPALQEGEPFIRARRRHDAERA